MIPETRRTERFRVAGAVFLAATWLSAAPSPAQAQTILNVERLQPRDVQGGHWGVEGEFSLSRGNTDYVDLLAGVVVGHRGPRDWLRAFVGLDYRDETGEGLENDRYLHVRHNRWWTERWQTFHFVQYQASHDSFQRRRILVGSGVRRRLVDGATTLDLGTGAMFEAEDLDASRVMGAHPLSARVWRMANLVVATRQLTPTVRLLGVAYVQPDLSDFGDLRTLADGSVLVALTEQVVLTFRGEWRRDSRPPENRRRNDVVFRTGLTLSFR